jgi:hypothetical protein
MMSWQSLGLRFCGMVELPTVPGGTGSSTSPNSVFISGIDLAADLAAGRGQAGPRMQMFSAR